MELERRRKAEGGFTFIEVMVVIILIALFAGAVGGTYSGPYKRMLLNKAARDVLLAAKYARTAAVEEQKMCKLVLDTVNRQVIVRVENWDAETGQTSESETRNAYWRTAKLGGDAQFEMVIVDKGEEEGTVATENQGEYTVTFRPDGMAENAVIQVGDGKKHYVVTISEATGLAKVVEGIATQFKSDTIDLDETGSETRTK
jgi:prepilin-type N-terminal cleavage/methylation domain-containing protein